MKPFNEVEKKYEGELKVGDFMLHGDVIITKLAELPENFNKMTKISDRCLAYGEVTGHLHQLQGTGFEIRECPETNKRYFKVDNLIVLKHQEHEALRINPGIYESDIQIEYDHFSERIREVLD